jgi:hypothetical protein
MKIALATLVLAFAAVLAGSAPASQQPQSPCPSNALAFGANPIAPATRTAVTREESSARPQVVEAVIATGDERGRGGEVKHRCGRKAAARTVVVYITLRKFLPSASLSERVSFVSHYPTGWRVWAIAH